MKKITLVLLTLFLSFAGYSQLSENFDSGTALPTGWVSTHNGAGAAVPEANKSWRVASTLAGGVTATSTPNFAYSERYSIQQGNTSTNWLITKAIVVPINGQIQFNTKQYSPQVQNGTTYQIKVSKVSQDTLTFANVVVYNEDEIDDGGSDWEQKTIALNATTYPVGSTIYVAFVRKQTQLTASPSADRYWLIDDVRVNSKCVTPISTVVANSVTLTSAQFSWSNASNATRWEIVIARENQTLEQAIADPTLFGIIIDSDGVPTLNLATITPAVVLTPDTNYKYYVRAVCAEDNKSDWADPTYFKTKALGESCAAPIVIPNIGYSVNGNTANSIDGTDVSQGTGCGAVPTGTNYMAGHDVFYTFTAPTTGEVRIEMIPGAPSTSVFVYNTCANVGVSCIAGVANNTAAPRIIPALSVTAGQSYIIVLSAAAATQTYNYYLEIQYVTCAEPTNLAATVNSQTNADLSWTNPFPATEWEYVVQPAGASIPTVAGIPVGTGDNVGVTTFTTNVSTGLVGSTSYQYWVRSKCTIGGTTFSPWAGPFQFFTPVCDPATTQICNYEFILRGTGGWRGALMHVVQNGVVVKVLGPEFTTGNSLTVPVPLCDGIPFSLLWVNGGTAPATVAITVNNSFGQQLYIKNANAIDQPSQVTPLYTKMVDCQFPDCLAPTNPRVSGTTTANTITLTWNATAGTTSWEVYAVIDGEGTAPDNAAAPGSSPDFLPASLPTNPPLTISNLRSDTNYRFYVRAVCGNGRKSDWVPAAALIRTLESCKFPNTPTVVANSISRTSANFSWNQGALNGVTPSQWQVVVQPATGIVPAYNAANAFLAPSNTNFQAPITLQSGTRYEYYVRAYCGVDNVSRWIGPTVFTTLCDPLPVPYSQGFNTTSDRVFCWSVLNNGGANAWALNYNVTPFEGDQSASIVPNNGTTNDDWLISPTLTLQANYRLRFKYKVQSATLANKIEIKLSTTGNSPVTAADFTETLMVPTTWNNTQYVEKIIYFSPASAGQQINVGWHLPLGEDNRNRIYIDDVVFEPIPVCPVPTFPIVENITSTSADLSWTAGYQETRWQVVVQAGGTGVPAAGVTGVLTTDNEDYQVTTNYLGQALQPGTIYEYYVRAYCNATDQSQWIGPISFKTLLCEEADKCEFIFTMRDTGNNPWQSTMSVIQNGEVVATLTGPLQGQATRPQTVRLCPGVQYSVFWNTESTAANAAQVGLTITNPYSEVVFTKNPGSGFQNTTLYRGMPFCGPITCPYPTNLQVSQTSGTSVQLTWTPGGTETQWQYLVLPAGSSYPGNTVGNVVNTTPLANVFGLSASVPYEIYVRAVCGPNNLSYWIGPIPFTIFNSPGCLSVDVVGVPVSAGFEKLVCPNDPCVSLEASYYQTKQTTSYTVDRITYLPPHPFNDPNATKIPVTADDDWSPLIDLTALSDGTGGSKEFNFCFYGNSYNKLLVTDNGAITFSITGTPGGLYAPSNANAGYQLSNPLPSVPNAAGILPYKNSIFGVLQDLNPATAPVSSSINYQVLGTFPCRAFVMSIDHLPNYSCNTSLQTSQIVLYEGSNIIDVYVESRTPCTGQLTGGQGLIGIQGNTNTQFSVPPNRNTGTWTATQEAWRFTPSGANENIQFEWRENGVPISTNLALNYCLPIGVNSALLEAVAIYPRCGTAEPVVRRSEIKVIRDLLPIEDPIDLKACIGTTTTFDLTLNNAEILDGVTNAANYLITYYLTLPEAESGTTGAITSHTTSVITPIYVRIYNTVTTCWETRTFNLVPNEPLPDYTLDTFDNDAIICTGEGTSLEVTPINFVLTDATYEWTLPDGTISTETSSVLTIAAGSLPEGVYNYSVKVDDGCETIKNFTLTVTNDDPVVAFHYTTPVCIASANPVAIPDGAPLTTGVGIQFTVPAGSPLVFADAVTGEIDLTQTPAGVYVITYEVAATTCTSLGTHSFTITIEDLEDPVTSFTITNATVCSNGTVTPTIVKDAGFTEGGTFAEFNSNVGLVIDQYTGVINLAGSTPGTYQVTYTVLKDIANCIDGEVGLPVQVTINPGVNADATFSYLKDTYCANEPSVLPNSITMPGGEFSVPPGTTGLLFNITTGEINISGSTPGDYEITYTIDDDALTCLKKSSFTLPITIENELDVNIDNDCINGNYTLTATPNDAAYTYTWKNSVGAIVGTNSPAFNVSTYLTTVTSPVYPLEFTVTINNGGCDSSEKFIVPNTSCNIPKGISPNGDGDNDQFDLTGFNVRKLEIFNRYGTKVYSKSNYVKEWIGQADNGNDLPDGTYYYVIERDNVKTATGWIQINRQRN